MTTSNGNELTAAKTLKNCATTSAAAPDGESLFAHYASLLDKDDLRLLSTVYATVAGDLSHEGLAIDRGELEKAVLLEGLGRKMGAGEIAKLVFKRLTAPPDRAGAST